MPAVSEVRADGFAVDEEAHTFRFVREFDASTAQVFAAWTTPGQLACWWDPTGDKLAVCEMDLRPGGSFTFATHNHRGMPFTGTYREIAPPELLAFDANGATGRVMIDDAEGKTRMTVEIACPSAEHFAQFIQIGIAQGTSQTLDNLVAYLD
jgi:uncharacterized protein YndB with AHSA1/START domain